MLPDRDTLLSRIPVPALAPLLAAAFAIVQPLVADLLGVTRWDHCYCGESRDTWGLGLTLVLWYTAVAVPAGLMLARRIVGRPGRARFSEYITGAVPAGLGVLLAMPVVVALARHAHVDGLQYPGIDAGLSVPIGAVVGVVAAAAALAAPAVVRGLVASWLWVWGLGVVAAGLLLAAASLGSQPLAGVDVVFGAGPDGGWIVRAVRDLGVVAAIAGPAAVAVLAALVSMRRRTRPALAAVGAVAGAALIVAAYAARGDALVGENHTWYVLAIVELLIAAVAVIATTLIVRFRRRRPEPAS